MVISNEKAKEEYSPSYPAIEITEKGQGINAGYYFGVCKEENMKEARRISRLVTVEQYQDFVIEYTDGRPNFWHIPLFDMPSKLMAKLGFWRLRMVGLARYHILIRMR